MRTTDKTFEKSAKIMDLEIYKMAWSPYIFLAKIANLMIIYPMKEKGEKKTLKISKNYEQGHKCY